MTAPISNGPTTHGYTTMRDANAVNLFQDLLLSLAASVAAGIQFLLLVRWFVKPELELTVN